MTTILIIILCLAIAIQSLIIHNKNKKIDALEYSAEFNLKQLQKSKAEWANESPISTMHRVLHKLQSDEFDIGTISTCRSYAASIMRIK